MSIYYFFHYHSTISHKIRICRSVIATAQYHNVSKTHIAALAHIAFADRQKHRTIAFTMCPFREIATALQATSRNDIKCFARSGISDVAYSTLSVIEQSNAATNPYFATFCPIFFCSGKTA